MAADAEKLKATLDELRQQLAAAGQLDPAQHDQLASALLEIQTALQAKTAPANAPLMRRLGEAVRNLEDSHPALSGAIGSLVDTLGRSGI
ncbi:MAG TPA: DUF4404 family protein [Pirellulales bacterium]|jgi:hypothetical protein